MVAILTVMATEMTEMPEKEMEKARGLNLLYSLYCSCLLAIDLFPLLVFVRMFDKSSDTGGSASSAGRQDPRRRVTADPPLRFGPTPAFVKDAQGGC